MKYIYRNDFWMHWFCRFYYDLFGERLDVICPYSANDKLFFTKLKSKVD